ncbi:MAG: amino acid adenylation domain-containing protein [Cyanobacteria bacterium J06598_3]
MNPTTHSTAQQLTNRLDQLSPEKRALLLKRLREQAAAKATVQEIEISPADRTQPLPLSFAQQRLWFLAQFEGASAAYNIASAVRIEGPLQLDLLEQAIQAVVARHEALRSTFQINAGVPVQVISPELKVPLEIVDLRAVAMQAVAIQAVAIQAVARERGKGDRAQAAYTEHVTQSTQAPFDLVNGPLLRLCAIRLADNITVVTTTMHHIISDGWSIGVLVKEVFSLYHALQTNSPSPLQPLPLQYPDFANWQREWLQGEVLDTQLSYWQQQMEGAPPLLELPSDRPRPPVHQFQGQSCSFEVPANLTAQLKTLAQETNTTLFMVLEGALAVLLYRLSHQEDVVIGSPIANRSRKALEPLIGFFVNTLLLRNDCSGNPTFKDFLTRVQQTAIAAYEHQDVPFEQLVDALKTERTLSYTPLFQVMFALQNAPMGAMTLADLTVTPLPLENPTAKFDITLNMAENDGILTGLWEYNTALFDQTTAERMVSQFQTLLTGITNNPDQPLLALPLLNKAGYQQIVVDWNQTAAPYPKETCLHELFETQAAQAPAAPAAFFREHTLTYGELNARANQLAHSLVANGFRPGMFAGICMERSLEMLVALLGVLKAGGVYVPMDPTYPADRLTHMLSDAQVTVLLTQSHLQEQLSALGAQARMVCLEGETATEFASHSVENLPRTRQATDLAYVIYTSGSTGKPKGVMIDHRGAVNTLADINRRYQVWPADRMLCLSSLSFDLSVYDIFGFLAAGGALVIPEPEAALDPARWLALIQQHQVTLWDTAPAVMELFANHVMHHQQRIPASLRVVMMSGDAISVTLPNQIKQLADNPAIRVNSLGGATEGSIWSICYPIDSVDPAWTSIPYGQPLDNQKFHILDQQLQPVPVGIPGELHIGGLGVALGYLNRPELNAQRFIPDPFDDRPDARLYKTGDMGRYRPDGVIEFLGRMDTQVKVRGFRVELGEIESLLVQQESVSEAVVVVWEPQSGDRRLCAYVVMAANEQPREQANEQDAAEAKAKATGKLRRALREQLPSYMVPAVFVTLKDMPLTANGKVNRKALPAPTEAEIGQREVAFVMPKTQNEQAIARIWQSVLQQSDIGTEDNFFDLGGHSLLMVQVHTQLQTELDNSLTIVELFQYPTIASLAQYLDQKQATPSAVRQGQQRQAARSQQQSTVAERRAARQRHRRR